MMLLRHFSLRSARSGVQQGQTGSIWARAARFHSSFALEIVMGRAKIWVEFGFALIMHYRLRAIKENSVISRRHPARQQAAGGFGEFLCQVFLSPPPRPPLKRPLPRSQGGGSGTGRHDGVPAALCEASEQMRDGSVLAHLVVHRDGDDGWRDRSQLQHDRVPRGANIEMGEKRPLNCAVVLGLDRPS
jgi:hypothetical protein